MDICALAKQIVEYSLSGKEDTFSFELINENVLQIIASLDEIEITDFIISLINGCLSKRHSSLSIRLHNCIEVPIRVAYELMAYMPTFELFFNPQFASNFLSDNNMILTLEPTIIDFIGFLLSTDYWPVDKMSAYLRTLTTMCLLTWNQAFICAYQKKLGDIIFCQLAYHLKKSNLFFIFENTTAYSPADIEYIQIIIVTVFRLISKFLQNSFQISISPIAGKNKPQGHLSLATNRSLLNLSNVYEKTFMTLNTFADFNQETTWLSDYEKSETVLPIIFTFLHKICKLHDRLKFTPDSSAFELAKSDIRLLTRLKLTQDLYVVQFNIVLTNFCNSFPPTFLSLTSSDIDILTRLSTPTHLNSELLQCKQQPVANKPSILHNVLYSGNKHIDLICWALDNGYCVLDYALVFVKSKCLSTPDYIPAVIPRLVQRSRELAVSSAFLLALVCQMNRSGSIKSSLIHETNLIRKIFPHLSGSNKAEIYSSLHLNANKTNSLLYPFGLNFSSKLRNLLNRLVATEDAKNQPASLSKPWMLSSKTSTLSSELLVECDMLLLTRPIDFLVELLILPVSRQSSAIFPVIYQILCHTSYIFNVITSAVDKSQDGRLFFNLFLPCTRMFGPTTSCLSDGGVSRQMPLLYNQNETDNASVSAQSCGESLRFYLPAQENFSPSQLSVTAQAQQFLKPTMKTAKSVLSVDLGLSDRSNSGTSHHYSTQELITYSIASLLDVPASWEGLPELVAFFISSWCSQTNTHTNQVCSIFVNSIQIILSPLSSIIPVDTSLKTCDALTGFLHLAYISRETKIDVITLCVCLLEHFANQCNDAMLQEAWNSLKSNLQSFFEADASFLRNCFNHKFQNCFPDCQFQINMSSINIPPQMLNETCFKKRFGNSLEIKFTTGITSDNEEQVSDTSTVDTISSSTLVSIFQLVSFSGDLWLPAVESILSAANQKPTIHTLWHSTSISVVILSLFVFLRQICNREENELESKHETEKMWARTVGFLDQLTIAGLLLLPYTMRPTSGSHLVYFNAPLLDWSKYRGTLDFFDLFYHLLAIHLENNAYFAKKCGHCEIKMLELICEGMEVVLQRLLVRIILSSSSDDVSLSALRPYAIGQVTTNVCTVQTLVKNCPKSNQIQPINKLLAALQVLEQSLNCANV